MKLPRKKGESKLLTFACRQGSGYDGALDKVYGFDMDGLDTLWREYVAIPAQPGEEKGIPLALIATLVGLATALLLVLGLAAESWAWRRGW